MRLREKRVERHRDRRLAVVSGMTTDIDATPVTGYHEAAGRSQRENLTGAAERMVR
jgi:hypothetical protein